MLLPITRTSTLFSQSKPHENAIPNPDPDNYFKWVVEISSADDLYKYVNMEQEVILSKRRDGVQYLEISDCYRETKGGCKGCEKACCNVAV